MIKINKSRLFIFDLDDTLDSERAFEISGIEYVLNKIKLLIQNLDTSHLLTNRVNWVDELLSIKEVYRHYTKTSLLHLYHTHIPVIELYEDAARFLNRLKLVDSCIALLTDGRSITQRNKLQTLGIASIFEKVFISEETGFTKYDANSFEFIERTWPKDTKIYFADNPAKDFYFPNRLGWETVGLLSRGANIHSQTKCDDVDYLPQVWITSFDEIELE